MAQNENPEITENLYFWIYDVQIHVGLMFNHYFNFLSVKTEVNKQTNKKQTQFNKSRGASISWKTKIWHMIITVAESFWEWCLLNSFSRVFEITFSYFSILGCLMNFHDFRFFVFRYKAPGKIHLKFLVNACKNVSNLFSFFLSFFVNNHW